MEPAAAMVAGEQKEEEGAGFQEEVVGVALYSWEVAADLNRGEKVTINSLY